MIEKWRWLCCILKRLSVTSSKTDGKLGGWENYVKETQPDTHSSCLNSFVCFI